MNQNVECCGTPLNIDWKSAIAYLKPNIPNDISPTFSLSFDDSPVLTDLDNGLLVSYVVDEGDNLGYIQNRHLSAAGINKTTLHLKAIDNLYSLAEKHLKVQPYGPVFALFMDGNFEASTLLLDTVWDISLARYVREGFVAALPARDVLAFGDSASEGAISELQAIVKRVTSSRADHALSNGLYRRTRKSWAVYEA
jgi:hypothetical protein